MIDNVIQNIKDCGQSLIDNAERIANDYKYSKNIRITCYVDSSEQHPYINVDHEFIPEQFMERLMEE